MMVLTSTSSVTEWSLILCTLWFNLSNRRFSILQVLVTHQIHGKWILAYQWLFLWCETWLEFTWCSFSVADWWHKVFLGYTGGRIRYFLLRQIWYWTSISSNCPVCIQERGDKRYIIPQYKIIQYLVYIVWYANTHLWRKTDKWIQESSTIDGKRTHRIEENSVLLTRMLPRCMLNNSKFVSSTPVNAPPFLLMACKKFVIIMKNWPVVKVQCRQPIQYLIVSSMEIRSWGYVFMHVSHLFHDIHKHLSIIWLIHAILIYSNCFLQANKHECWIAFSEMLYSWLDSGV